MHGFISDGMSRQCDASVAWAGEPCARAWATLCWMATPCHHLPSCTAVCHVHQRLPALPPCCQCFCWCAGRALPRPPPNPGCSASPHCLLLKAS